MERKRHQRYKCTECGKWCRTTRGLEWHLYHIHGWQDRPLPGLVDQVKEAMTEKILLQVFCKGAGITLDEALEALALVK